MLSQLTKLVVGDWFGSDYSEQTPSLTTTAEGVEDRNTRLTSTETEDEWVLVNHRTDSDGNSEFSSVENLNVEVDGDYNSDDGVLLVEESPDRVLVVDTRNLPPVQALLSRTNSAPSMEESWFLTPPPCFSSAGPVHMQTSPMENLLIEHPSMSVYKTHMRVYRKDAMDVASSSDSEHEEELDDRIVEEVLVEEEEEAVEGEEPVVVYRACVNRVHELQLQERQGLKCRQAQKVQIKKAAKAIKRGNLDRNNKAREANSRNRRQRRGERSQGATRSNANNNRKC